MSDATIRAVSLALILILPIGALAARRLPLGETMKMALAWVAIFGVLFILVSLWQGAMGTGSEMGASSSERVNILHNVYYRTRWDGL